MVGIGDPACVVGWLAAHHIPLGASLPRLRRRAHPSPPKHVPPNELQRPSALLGRDRPHRLRRLVDPPSGSETGTAVMDRPPSAIQMKPLPSTASHLLPPPPPVETTPGWTHLRETQVLANPGRPNFPLSISLRLPPTYYAPPGEGSPSPYLTRLRSRRAQILLCDLLCIPVLTSTDMYIHQPRGGAALPLALEIKIRDGTWVFLFLSVIRRVPLKIWGRLPTAEALFQ